ncbi:MAG TPA: HDIG domain-containing protein [Bacteroidales bacterium]|nr:HDIG domain-containing protein [Bacteroidales bacterium]
MPDLTEILKPRRKFIINLIFFFLSIITVVVIWPREMNDTWFEILGSIIVVSSCYMVLYLFLNIFRPEILEVTRKTFFIILIIITFIVLTRVVVSFYDHSILFLIPFAVIPIVISAFYDERLALFILLVTIMLAGFIVPNPFEFIFMNFISGVLAIFSMMNIYRRAKLLFSSLVVVFSYSVIYFAINIINTESIANLNWAEYKWFLGNGIIVLLSYPLIFLFEKEFLFLSDSTLLELSDTNQPLLRRLAEEAPGSFQHSRQVANLAEEASRAVGANLLLTRVGALYHDVGKVINSEYFIENQAKDYSPHHDLGPLESSKVIIKHVDEGVDIARKYKLPIQIIDFIRTHHGTTKAYYFYKKYLEKNQRSNDIEKDFVYPGPKPFSKEMAIVMMADAVEASSRTLESYTEFTISELVERIFIIQEQDDQFSDAPLTFKDISDIKSVFKKRLQNIYHARIAYPERDIKQD